MSATSGEQVDVLAGLLTARLPAGPMLYPGDVTTDNDLERRIAELVREAALADVRDELPHSIAVTVDEIRPPRLGVSRRSSRRSTSSGTARRAS